MFYKGLLFILAVSCFATAKPVFIVGEKAESISLYPSEKLKISQGLYKEEKTDRTLIQIKKKSHLKIGVPAEKIHVVLQTAGKISVQGLKKADLSISIQKGSVEVQKSSGRFTVSVDQGRVDFQESGGRLLARLYSAPLSVSKFNGKMDILSYSSPVSIQNSKGEIKAQGYSSPLNVQQVKGSLNFRSQKSDISLKNFEGDLKGYSQMGAVSGSITPKNVQVETDSGKIRLYFQGSRARVSAQSWEAKVYAPKNFYTDRAGGVYKARGTIQDRGKAEGRVSLKSRSGKIYIL